MEKYRYPFKRPYASKAVEKHRLAAIMFTDIVGYTEIMGKNERKALELLEKNQRIQKSIIEIHGGRVLKEIGDGMLVSFNSSIDSVLCAKQIIETVKIESELSLRIGIHEGDIVFKDNDVYGDGVNIASRLQDEAIEDRIYISESVYNNVRNKPDVPIEFIGEKNLKNVDHPVKIYSIINQDFVVESSEVIEEISVEDAMKSIIILPFQNLSSEKDQEYFSDGLTEEIITDLSQIQNFRIISRNSSMCFKGTKKNTREIAKEVNAQYVLEGSVWKSGNNLRITTQLIDARSDSSIWAEKYYGTTDDVFNIQEKVSLSIVEALKAKLQPAEKNKLTQRDLESPRALECYFKAKNEMVKKSEEGFSNSLNELQNGLEITGDNARLFANIGLLYLYYYNTGIIDDEKFLSIAQEYGQKAMKADPKSSIGFLLMGAIKRYQGDSVMASKYFNKALDQNAFSVEALVYLCKLYSLQMDRPLEAESLISKILEIDPMTSNNYVLLGFIHWMENNLESALSSFKKSLNLDPENLYAKFWLIFALAWNGQNDEAIGIIDQFLNNEIDSNMEQALLNWCLFFKYSMMGNKSKALDSFNSITRNQFWKDPDLIWPGIVNFSLINDNDEALNWLERAIELGWMNYSLFLERDPFIANLRDDPKFLELMNMMKKKFRNLKT